MNKLIKSNITIILLLISSFGFCQAETSTLAQLMSPEEEISRSLTTLDNINRQIETARSVPIKQGFGSQSYMADEAFDSGIQFFDQKEFFSAVREINAYLLLSQKPDPLRHMKALNRLGHTYETIGYPRKAIQAYTQSVSVCLSSPKKDFDLLYDSLKNLLPLSAKYPKAGDNKLSELLAAVMSLEIPTESRAKIVYIAAKHAASNGYDSQALRWLTAKENTSNDPVIANKSLYLQSLIHLNKKEYEQAQEKLTQVASAPEAKAEDLANLANLGLARIAVHKKNPTAAAKLYEQIKEDSPSFADALYESVFVNLAAENSAAARARAMTFLARFDQDNRALHIRHIMNYLDIKGGDLTAAKSGVSSSDAKLTTLKEWFRTGITKDGKVSNDELHRIFDKTAYYLDQPRLVKDGIEQFSSLSELKQRLEDARGETLDMIYTLGSIRIEGFMPEWTKRVEQLTKISEDILAEGQRLSASERQYHQPKISLLDKANLEASESRRQKLLGKSANMRRKITKWATFSNLITMNQDLAKNQMTLAKAKSDLTAMETLSKTVNETEKATLELKIKSLRQKITLKEEGLNKTRINLQTLRIESIINQSPHYELKKFFSQYSEALEEEGQILAKMRSEAQNPNQRFLVEDFDQAWNKWRSVSKKNFMALNEFEKEVKDEIKELIKNLARFEDRYRTLTERHHMITGLLESAMGKSLSPIIDQYNYETERRLSQNRKWAADIDYIENSNINRNSESADRKFELESQILQNQLRDLQQGALWQ